MKKLLTIFPLMLFGNLALADISIGIGRSYAKMYPDGKWKQDGFSEHRESDGKAISIGYLTERDKLETSISLIYKEGPNAWGEFVTDDCHGQADYKSEKCSDLYVAETVETKTWSVVPLLKFKIPMDGFTVSAGGGASIYYSYVRITWDRKYGVCANKTCDDGTYQRFGFSPVFELSANYNSYYLSVQWALDERAREEMSRGYTTFLVGKVF